MSLETFWVIHGCLTINVNITLEANFWSEICLKSHFGLPTPHLATCFFIIDAIFLY